MNCAQQESIWILDPSWDISNPIRAPITRLVQEYFLSQSQVCEVQHLSMDDQRGVEGVERLGEVWGSLTLKCCKLFDPSLPCLLTTLTSHLQHREYMSSGNRLPVRSSYCIFI